MSRRKSAIKAVREWLAAEELCLYELCNDVGDPGRQLQRWMSEKRETLPLRLKVRISQRTGIPLERLVEANELQLARDIIVIMARDASDTRPAA